MKAILLKIMLFISMSISVMKTPMSMGVLLLTYTMLTTFLMSKMLTSSWMSMIIFLMLIGGLLILFMYMSSIASNEKFTPNIMIMLVTLIIIIPIEEMMNEIQINEKEENLIKEETMTLTKIYNEKSMLITLMMFIYLLLTMIVVTKIIKIYKGPLRSKNFN
uniref:NADH-ubiquinone oxidoreductase chain 6 n=1 Tax=Phlogotettix sp. EMHAU-2015-Zz052705 TaxID=2038639 RepID=A0A343K5X2_9HEMI|nr:NADH dehydrogenase subunit 6 [Phlogotettix sp. EMHAU-2015-Zz052705]